MRQYYSETILPVTVIRILCGPLFILFWEDLPLIMSSRGITAGKWFYAYLHELQPRKMTVCYVIVYIYITKQGYYTLNMHHTFILSYQSGTIKVGWIRDRGNIQRSIYHTCDVSSRAPFPKGRHVDGAYVCFVCRASLLFPSECSSSTLYDGLLEPQLGRFFLKVSYFISIYSNTVFFYDCFFNLLPQNNGTFLVQIFFFPQDIYSFTNIYITFLFALAVYSLLTYLVGNVITTYHFCS